MDYDTTLHKEFIKVARKNPKKTAVVDRTTGRTLSYAQLLIGSVIVAKHIKKNYKDGFIGVMLPNTAGSIISVISVLMAGKVPVMINYSTGAYNNTKFAQKRCGFRTVLTSRAFLKKIGCNIAKGMIFIEDIMSEVNLRKKLTAALKVSMPVNLLLKRYGKGSPDDNAVILFTSGSEKDPKAVQLTHNNLYSNINSAIEHIGFLEEEVVLGILPFFHVYGFNTNLWLPLLNGYPVVTYANPVEYRKVCEVIKEEKVTIMIGTPVFFAGYMRKAESGDFKTLRFAVAGADKMPESLSRKYADEHGVVVLEGYGTTETSPVISVNLRDNNKLGSIGLPLPGVNVEIHDINTGEPLPAGSEGKIMVKGDLVMKGYFDDIEETSLRIKDGWYDTGDMGMLDDDGFLWHRGRLKRFVKIGGEMVSLVRVESVMTDLMPEDVECCIVEVPDSIKGARIIAAVSGKVDSKKILKKASKELPNIALPRDFVELEELPRMGSGKVDFRTTAELVRETLINVD